MIIRIPHNRNSALERSVINYWGLKLFNQYTTLTLDSDVIHKHTSYSVRVKDFNASKQQTYTSRYNQQQDQHWNPGATEIQQFTPMGLTKDRASSPNQINWKILGHSHR